MAVPCLHPCCCQQVFQKERSVDKLLNDLLKGLKEADSPEGSLRALYACLARGSEGASDEVGHCAWHGLVGCFSPYLVPT